MLWALMKHELYVINQSFEECKVSGKLYKVQFGHHVESFQYSNLSTDSIYSTLHQIRQVVSNINMLAERHTHSVSFDKL
jgi:hypothetical protein